MRLDDPDVVRREYATEGGLRARQTVYEGLAAPDAREAVFEAVAEGSPRRVLEVGCGWGELSARMRDELGAEVMAVDLSPRMVELARERGVDAQVGDVQNLPFEQGSFDVAVAAWMLYHVPDLGRGLAELARVLRPQGRLVAATNGLRHLAELWSLVGRDRSQEPIRFCSETGETQLRKHFRRVRRRDIESTVVFADPEAVRGYVRASILHKHLSTNVPDFVGPLDATRRITVFVAETDS